MAETSSCSADADHGAAPGCEFGEYAGHHTAAHAAKGRAADIKPHGEAEPARMDLFGEIGHGDRRCAAERYAFERPYGDHQRPVRRRGRRYVENRCDSNRNEHEAAPAEAFRESGCGQNGKRQKRRRQRQGE